MRSRSFTRSHPDRSTNSTRRRLALGASAGVATLALAVGGSCPLRRRRPAPVDGNAKGDTVDINLVTVNDFHGRIEQSGAAGGIAAAVDRGQPDPRREPEHDLRRRRRHDRRVDVHVVHPAGRADDRDAERGGPRRERGRATTSSTRASPTCTDRVMPLALVGVPRRQRLRQGHRRPRACPSTGPRSSTASRIGFVGAVTDELPSLVSPAGIEDITVGRPVEAANRVADQLSDGKSNNGEADIVILLVHEGAATTDIVVGDRPELAVRPDRAERRTTTSTRSSRVTRTWRTTT